MNSFTKLPYLNPKSKLSDTRSTRKALTSWEEDMDSLNKPSGNQTRLRRYKELKGEMFLAREA